MRRGRAGIREKPLKPVGLLPANIRDSRAPRCPPALEAHPSHPPLLEALLVQAQQLVACGQVQLCPYAHHSAGINSSLIPCRLRGGHWPPLPGALPACHVPAEHPGSERRQEDPCFQKPPREVRWPPLALARCPRLQGWWVGSTSDSYVCPHPAALLPEPAHEQGGGWMRDMASSPSISTTTHGITPLDETHLTDGNTELQWQEVICPGSRSDGHVSTAAAPDAASGGGGELGGGSRDGLCAASRCPGGHSLL